VDPILIGSGLFILGAVVWITCAVLAYRTAPTFGRGAWAWAILGIIFGPIALMILYLLPKHEPKAGHGKHRADPRTGLYEKPHKD
jgi:hypothetical protein